MSYRIEPHDRTLQHLLRRVAREELDGALARLAVAPPPSAEIHGVRKHVKKLRGLLRLMRPGLPVFQAENAALRAAAAGLAALRDADVRLATLDRLTGPDRPALLVPLREVLAGPTQRRSGAADPALAAQAALACIRARVDDWELTGKDQDILHAGLARTRRQARRAMAQAQATPTAEAMHDWRKRVKDGWYQARLLAPIHPQALLPLAEQAGVLGEDLGDHHDLAVLADHVAALPDAAVSPEARSEILHRISRDQARLEAQIFPLGKDLLAEKPQAMASRWTGWWQDWRG